MSKELKLKIIEAGQKAVAQLIKVAKEDIINLVPRRESNANEAIGKEEADNIYDLGALAEATFNFNKAQPQHFAFLCAYGLGACATVAAGSGYKHTCTPILADLDAARSNPSFTATFRYGNQVMKRRYASMCRLLSLPGIAETHPSPA